MDNTNKRFIFEMNIPLKAHAIAQDFCQKQPDASKAKQIYLNTLAVYSVNEYLGYLSIPTNLDTSDSWSPSLQYLLDVADLDIPNYGRLECRPVLPDDTRCYVPAEVWSDRIGYLAIQFDTDLKVASFLGFLPTVQSSFIALDQWDSFEAFIENISQVINTTNDVMEITEIGERKGDKSLTTIQLSQWLKGTIDNSWQLLHHAFSSPELSPAFRSHSHDQLTDLAQVVCSKHLKWSDSADSIPLSLTIGLAPSEQSAETDIWVKITPQSLDHHLPPDLELLIVDEDEHTVIQAKSRGTEGIQLRFGGQADEQFRVKVIQGAREMIETFVI